MVNICHGLLLKVFLFSHKSHCAGVCARSCVCMTRLFFKKGLLMKVSGVEKVSTVSRRDRSLLLLALTAGCHSEHFRQP